ncbi:MAG: hypothetical protein IIA61_00195 [Candidatus Marinimicrobia bacterium]|nr:hypothetical protein [Candidatus Neomarinimicrobiota bacterium]
MLHDETALQRQIDATDRQIDQLVYKLYELTVGEIRLIEETTDNPRLHKLRRTGRDCGGRNKKRTGKKDDIFY